MTLHISSILRYIDFGYLSILSSTKLMLLAVSFDKLASDRIPCQVETLSETTQLEVTIRIHEPPPLTRMARSGDLTSKT